MLGTLILISNYIASIELPSALSLKQTCENSSYILSISKVKPEYEIKYDQSWEGSR